MRNIARPLKLGNGNEVYLASGKYGDLQRAIIEKFVPQFIADATMLYLGDMANKSLVCEQKKLEQMLIPITTHHMLADIILFQEVKNCLYLITIGISYGFISHERHREIEALLEKCTAKRVYISVFPNMAEYKRYVTHIAWGSHVWIAEIPEHTIYHE